MALISFVVERPVFFLLNFFKKTDETTKGLRKAPPFILSSCATTRDRRETFDDDDAKSFSRSKGTRAETHPRGNDDDREE